MQAYQIAALSFLGIFGGALAGFLIQGFLPHHHLSGESKGAVHLGAGLIATLAALILGLLVSSTKATYDETESLVNEMSASYAHVDRLLANYGAEAAPIRPVLRGSLEKMLNIIWPEESKSGEKSPLQTRMELEHVDRRISLLNATDQYQQELKSNALHLVDDIIQKRWLLQEIVMGGGISFILLVFPVLFIAFITLIYALYAPRNLTVAAALLCCSLCIAIAVFLISELSSPLQGTLKISSKPLQIAIDQMGME